MNKTAYVAIGIGTIAVFGSLLQGDDKNKIDAEFQAVQEESSKIVEIELPVSSKPEVMDESVFEAVSEKVPDEPHSSGQAGVDQNTNEIDEALHPPTLPASESLPVENDDQVREVEEGEVATVAVTEHADMVWYVSSHHSSKYYYHESCDGWQGLSPRYLKSFSTESELRSAVPGRTLHHDCVPEY